MHGNHNTLCIVREGQNSLSIQSGPIPHWTKRKFTNKLKSMLHGFIDFVTRKNWKRPRLSFKMKSSAAAFSLFVFRAHTTDAGDRHPENVVILLNCSNYLKFSNATTFFSLADQFETHQSSVSCFAPLTMSRPIAHIIDRVWQMCKLESSGIVIRIVLRFSVTCGWLTSRKYYSYDWHFASNESFDA